jgi:hypothetical protein
MFSFDARDRGGSKEWMRAWGEGEVEERGEAVGEERTTWEAEMAALWATEATERRRLLGEAGKVGRGPASR